MKSVTKEIINIYKIKKFDFMGYDITDKKKLSFHHLIIAKRYCKQQGLGDGYYLWNGAVLVQNTSHDYLHLIERVDPEIFCLITSEMIDENLKRRLDIYNLRKIRDLILYFEQEHRNEKDNKSHNLIKREYTQNRFSCLN